MNQDTYLGQISIDSKSKMEELLNQCCNLGAEAILSGPQINYPAQVHFCQIANGTVDFRLDVEYQSCIVQGTICNVHFVLEDKFHSFYTTIVNKSSLDDFGAACLVSVAFPKAIIADYPRKSNRITVPENVEVTIVAKSAETTLLGSLIDVCTSGSCIVADQFGMPEFKIGDSVQLEVSYNGLETVILAQVRWVRGEKVGFFFDLDSPTQAPSAGTDIENIIANLVDDNSSEVAA